MSRRVAEGAASIVLVAWVGSLWAIGYIAAPVLFASLPDKQLAGMLAGRLFEIGAWVGMAAAVYLLGYRLLREGASALKTGFFWLVLIMLLFTAASHFGIAPIMQSLKDQAMPQAVMQSMFADRFARWHGISSIVYLVNSVLGLVLVWRAGCAR